LIAHSNSNSELESDTELEVNYPEIPLKISKYNDELCLNLKSTLKMIFELKRENSQLRQHDIFQKEKFENLQNDFMKTKES